MRTLLVSGLKEFRIQIPDDARVTFGPFSPPSSKDEGRYSQEAKKGTLRIYQGVKENVIGVFTNIDGFRDVSQIVYEEKIAVEEGASVWKNDRDGYTRYENVKRESSWVDPESPKQLVGASEPSIFDEAGLDVKPKPSRSRTRKLKVR